MEDSLRRLDSLTQEESQMAAAELRKAVDRVDDKVDHINSPFPPKVISPTSQPSHTPTGNQIRDSLRTWLSPSNPSINHNIAREAHHEGSAEWFFRGGIYKQWKSAGPFLWIHGKRAFLVSCFIQQVLIIANLTAGSGKSILWSVFPFHLFPLGTYRVI